MSTSTSLAISGLASGFDWQSLVSQLCTVQRDPETLLEQQQATIQNQNSALSAVQTALATLQTDATTLSSSSFFDTRTATSSDTSYGTATAAEGTAQGTYKFGITQLATNAVLEGTSAISSKLSSTNDVSGVTLSSGRVHHPGDRRHLYGQWQTGHRDHLGIPPGPLQRHHTATNKAVTASYSTSSDEITLSSSSEIVLGSATDTSNFLSVAKLTNNETGSVTSPGTLGRST